MINCRKTQVQAGDQNTLSAHIQLPMWCKWKKSKKWHLRTSALGFTGYGVALYITCDHFKHSSLCRCDGWVMDCRWGCPDNCGERSVIQQNICLFRPKPTWSDETSLSLLIREFICFLFSHRLIVAVALNSCETSCGHPPRPHCQAPAADPFCLLPS